jgi:hypothetical protein
VKGGALRASRGLIWAAAWVSAASAQTLHPNDHPDAAMFRRFTPPQVDRVRFEPLPVEQRVLKEPRVKYLARQDGYEYCSRITGMPVSATSRPMACAFWNVRRNECTVVTPQLTGYNYVGHELRHCFEGGFHD